MKYVPLIFTKKEYSDEEILKMNLELAELLGLKLNIETMELY